jgi:hypothetical protein
VNIVNDNGGAIARATIAAPAVTVAAITAATASAVAATSTAAFRVGHRVANASNGNTRGPGPPLERCAAAQPAHAEAPGLAARVKKRHAATHAAHAEECRGLARHQAGGGSSRDSNSDGG